MLAPKGFNLVELLIGLILGSILILGLINLLNANARANIHNVAVSQLNQTLRVAMSMMEQDIRRAGYWNQADSMIGTGTNTNPFLSAGTDLTVSADGSCILYSYDLNNDGVLADIDDVNNERFGFRLNNKILQMRPASGSASCDDVAALWDNVTDPNVIQITVLNFVPSTKVVSISGSAATMQVRSVLVSLSAQLTQDNTKTVTLSNEVKVRNDVFSP